MHVDQGSTINLTCVSKFNPTTPSDVTWYLNGKVSLSPLEIDVYVNFDLGSGSLRDRLGARTIIVSFFLSAENRLRFSAGRCQCGYRKGEVDNFAFADTTRHLQRLGDLQMRTSQRSDCIN